MNNYKPHPAQERFFNAPRRDPLYGGGQPPRAGGSIKFANGSTLVFGPCDVGDQFEGSTYEYLCFDCDDEEVDDAEP